MLKALRLLTLFVTPLVFWGVWHVAPDVLDAQGLRWLSSIVPALWGLEFYFFRRLDAVSSVDGLSSREHERLVLRLAEIRRRVWWIGGIGFFCALMIWILAALQLPTSSPTYAAAVGVLFGISLSYLILIPVWFNESQSFLDEVRRQDALTKKRADIVKDLQPPSAKSNDR